MADLDDIVAILEDIRDDTVPGLTSSIENLTDATGTATAASREAAQASRELSENVEETGEKAEEAKDQLGSYTMGLDRMAKGMKKTGKGFGTIIKGFGEVIGGAVKAARALKENSDGIVSSIQTSRRMTGMSKQMAFQIADTADALRIYGVSAEDANTAVNTLYDSTSVYSQLSSEMQGKLATEGALLAGLGVSMSDYAQGIEIGMKSMGMTAEEASGNMLQLRATAIDLNMPISTLTANFAKNANMLAKLGDNGVQAFSELTRISKITGMEMNKLLAVTDKFDTFEGAAEAAGSLNAALGGNFVDSMSLMMETDPAERFKMIRNAIEDAGVAVQDMGYYQKKMMADAAGFSDVGDFAAAMSGDLNALAGDMGKTDASVAAAMETAAVVRTPEEMAANFARALEPAAGAIAKTMVKASDDFGKGMLPTIAALDASTKAMTANLIVEDDNNILGTVMNLIGYMETLGPIIMTVVGYFGGFGTIASGALSVLTGALTTIGGVLGSFPVLVVAIIAALTAGFMGIAIKFGEIEDLFSAGKFLDAFSVTFMAFFTGVIAAVGKVAAYIAEALGFDSPWITTFKDAFNPETFDKIMNSIAIGIYDGFASIYDSIVGFFDGDAFFVAATGLGEALIDGFYDFFQISSPSKVMMDMIGGPILDGILAPFKDLPKLLKELMMSAMNALPAPLKALITGEGGVLDTASDLAGMAAEKAASVVSVLAGNEDRNKEPYEMSISLNMDGREFDKKVIKVVGGVARNATGG